VDRVNASRPRAETGKRTKNEVFYRKLLEGKLDHLASEDRKKIEPVLLKYAHFLHDEESNDFIATELVEHEINLENPTPIRWPQYRTPFTRNKGTD